MEERIASVLALRATADKSSLGLSCATLRFVAGNNAESSSIQLFNSREEMRPVFPPREGRGRSSDEAADYAFG